MNKNTDKHFKLSNLYAAAFLITKGLTLSDIEPISNRKSLFVFLDSPQRERLMQEYQFSTMDSNDCLVDARKFIQAIKTLKERLYQ